MGYPITTQSSLRNAFWEEHPNISRHPGWTQNQYPTDVRMLWCDYIEAMRRNKQISDALANRATL